MRKSFLFNLMLALVFLGVVTLSSSYIALGEVVPTRSPTLVAQELSEDNGIVVDNVRFETIVPDRVWVIPEVGTNAVTHVRIGLQITNQKQEPIRVTSYESLYLILTNSNGQTLYFGLFVDHTFDPPLSDFPVLKPGESIIFTSDANLLRVNSSNLRLEVPIKLGGIWFCDNLSPGSYQVGISYRPFIAPTFSIEEIEQGFGVSLADLWVTEANPPLVPVQIENCCKNQ